MNPKTPQEEFLAKAARELAASGAFAFDPVKRATSKLLGFLGFLGGLGCLGV